MTEPKPRTLADRVVGMNQMYKLQVNSYPVLPEGVADRVAKFKRVLHKEVDELDDVSQLIADNSDPLDVLTEMADLLGDVVVYCYSESLKYGLPLDDVLQIIMDSNESKLGADGKPIYGPDGNFLKGPNYWKPQPVIRELLRERMGLASDEQT